MIAGVVLLKPSSARSNSSTKASITLTGRPSWVLRCEVCRKMGISDATFYNWRTTFGGLSHSEVQRMKRLEEENAKLERLVADLSLDKAMLQDVLAKKSEAFPAA